MLGISTHTKYKSAYISKVSNILEKTYCDSLTSTKPLKKSLNSVLQPVDEKTATVT